jgi:hypothetical protein
MAERKLDLIELGTALVRQLFATIPSYIPIDSMLANGWRVVHKIISDHLEIFCGTRYGRWQALESSRGKVGYRALVIDSEPVEIGPFLFSVVDAHAICLSVIELSLARTSIAAGCATGRTSGNTDKTRPKAQDGINFYGNPISSQWRFGTPGTDCFYAMATDFARYISEQITQLRVRKGVLDSLRSDAIV